MTLDLSTEKVDFDAFWFNPEQGGELLPTEVANQRASTGFDPGSEPGNDRVLILKAKQSR